MVKNPTPIAVANAAETPVADTVAVTLADLPELTLAEFCSRLSEREKRYALIGGFEHVERITGNLKDTGEAYQARFIDFINKPA